MRTLIYILLFCLPLGGFSQGFLLNPYAFGASELLLDIYSGAAVAVSLHKLDKDYTGNCVRVRRASDNAEQNIGFIDNYCDTAALKTFCATTDGFVTTWYDQSGNGINFVQTTAANQPKICTNGVIETQNSLQCVRFNVNDDNLSVATIPATIGSILLASTTSIQVNNISIPANNLAFLGPLTRHPLQATFFVLWPYSLSELQTSGAKSELVEIGYNSNIATSLLAYNRDRTPFTSVDTTLNYSIVTNFQDTWRNCNSLTSFPLLDVSSGTNFNTTWFNCTALTSFPLLNVSSGTSFTQAWFNCNSLTSFPLLDVSTGINFQETWRNCTSLTSFPLLDVSSGTNFQQTWQNCKSLTSFPLLDVSSGTNFIATWSTCNSLTSFPLLDVSSGTNFSEAWFNCTALTSFPANMFDTNNCTNYTGAFLSCALNQTSVDNILVSIAASAALNNLNSGTLAISGGTNATPGVAGRAAADALRARSWTVTLNGY